MIDCNGDREMLRNRRGIPALICVVLACLSIPAAGGEPDPRVKPGADFRVQFPDLPKTLNADIAEMHLMIPNDYDPETKHPIFLWMNGNKGHPGAWTAASITERKKFICVSFPLFKEKTANGATVSSVGEIYFRMSDAPFMWEQLKIMIDRLNEMVPNINWDISISGGFSNGAHATAQMANNTGGEFGELFHNFVLWEGGDNLSNLKPLEGNAIAIIWGEKSLKGSLSALAVQTKGKGIRTLAIEQTGVGHEVVDSYYPDVGKWVLEDVLLGSIPSGIEETYTLLKMRKYREAVEKVASLKALAEGYDAYQSELADAEALLEKFAGKALEKVERMKDYKEYLRERKIEKLEEMIADWKGTEAAEKGAELLENLKAGITAEPEEEAVTGGPSEEGGDEPEAESDVNPEQERKAKVFWDMALQMITMGEIESAQRYLQDIIDRYPESSYVKKAEEKLKEL
jgi:hypothetical protein